MSEILRKVTSRKFLMAVVGMVSGLALAFGVEGGEIVELVGMIGGIVAAAGSAITYINAEAKVDAARAAAVPVIVQEEQDTVVEGFK
jgi:hypothetical protein